MNTSSSTGQRSSRRAVGWKPVAGLALGLMSMAACEPPDEIPPRYRPLADAVEKELLASGAPGVAVAVVEKGQVTFARGFGTKGPGQTDAVKPSTLFRMGSRLKGLTAIALLQSVQEGKVDLDAPVTDYIPGFHLTRSPGPVPAIKVRHLLEQTSGIADRNEPDPSLSDSDDTALEKYFTTGTFCETGYVQTPPGAMYAYANPNYMLAGLVAEKVRGVPYRQLMHDRVFSKLGMDRTVFLASEVLADGDYTSGKACTAADPGCRWPEMGTVAPEDNYLAWARPAGFAWSSVLDLAKLANFLTHGDSSVLRDDLRTAMVSHQAVMPELAGIGWYGFGNMIMRGIQLAEGEYYELETVSHGGTTPGYSTSFVCIPARDFCFISLANGDNAYFGESLVVAIKTLVELPAPVPVPDITPKPERYPAYAGVYVDPFDLGEVRISTADGKLLIELPSADAGSIPYTRQLQPTTTDSFVFTVAGFETPLTFVADGAGAYKYAYSRPYVAVRTSPAQ